MDLQKQDTAMASLQSTKSFTLCQDLVPAVLFVPYYRMGWSLTFDISSGLLNDLWELDTITMVWFDLGGVVRGDPVTPRVWFGFTAEAGYIYVFGGLGEGSCRDLIHQIKMFNFLKCWNCVLCVPMPLP